ncbi:hypothetical protein Ais01nite_73690 [Asanoa ishikariensis]|nr:hypothetical protein Ais01nite_73690 [Asanoa ishikariensis]
MRCANLASGHFVEAATRRTGAGLAALWVSSGKIRTGYGVRLTIVAIAVLRSGRHAVGTRR